MAGRKASIYLTDKAEEALNVGSDSISGRVSFLVQSAMAVAESPNNFTLNEWIAAIAAANGFRAPYELGFDATMYAFAQSIPRALISNIDINKMELAQKFHELPDNQKLFVFEIARKAWLKQLSDYESFLKENNAILNGK